MSTDGTRAAYTTGSWQSSRLAVAGFDGSGERLLTTPDQSGVAWNARFSPDGRHIAFTGRDAGGQLHIFVAGVNGTSVRQLTRFKRDQGRAQVPAWFPDGKRLAFQSNRSGRMEVWTVNLDGSQPRQVTGTPVLLPDQQRTDIVTTNGMRFAAEWTSADEDAPAALLFPMCWATPPETWAPVADRLRTRGVSALVITYPGSGGNSPWPGPHPPRSRKRSTGPNNFVRCVRRRTDSSARARAARLGRR